MERPRRSVRPPGALSDFLTVGEVERRPVAAGEGKETQQEQPEEEKNNQDVKQSEPDDKLILSQPYKCRECKARYRSKVALLRHAGKHNGEKPFLCSECGKGLSSQCALSEHMNIHTNNRPHRCDECGLESRQLSVHLRHLLIHQATPDHLYTCSVCTRTFKQNEYLRRHMRKHTGEKPYVCHECGKAFTCKSELNRHGKRHSPERPHICQECGRSFKMRHNLRAHLRGHAGTQQWRCLLCPAVFPKMKLLEAHRRTHQENVHHLHISRPDDHTLLVYAAGGDRRRLPTLHPIPLPAISTAPPSNTLKNCNPTNQSPENASEVNNSSQSATLHSPNPLSPTMENLIPQSQKLPSTQVLSTTNHKKNESKKFLRINDTTLPLDLILKTIGKGGAIRVKIIDRPLLRPGPEATPPITGGCRRDGDSVVELVDGEISNKRDDLEYQSEGGSGVDGGREREGLKVEASLEGETETKTGMVEAVDVLGAGASVLSHCLAPHYTHPAPPNPDYCDWLAALVSFCQQLQPPLDPEVCQCLVNTTSALQKCLVLEPGSVTSQELEGEATSTTRSSSMTIPVKGEVVACQDSQQYQLVHQHYLSVLTALHRHYSHLITDLT